MKKLFLLFILFLPLLGKAQITMPEYNKIKTLNDIGAVVVDKYQPQKDSVDANCWSGCVFVRFTINSKRQFTHIDYTATTPLFIKNALINAFAIINQNA